MPKWTQHSVESAIKWNWLGKMKLTTASGGKNQPACNHAQWIRLFHVLYTQYQVPELHFIDFAIILCQKNGYRIKTSESFIRGLFTLLKFRKCKFLTIETAHFLQNCELQTANGKRQSQPNIIFRHAIKIFKCNRWIV